MFMSAFPAAQVKGSGLVNPQLGEEEISSPGPSSTSWNEACGGSSRHTQLFPRSRHRGLEPRRCPGAPRDLCGREEGDLAAGSDLLPPLGNRAAGAGGVGTAWGRRREAGRDGGGAERGAAPPTALPELRALGTRECAVPELPLPPPPTQRTGPGAAGGRAMSGGCPQRSRVAGDVAQAEEVLVKTPEALGGPEEQRLPLARAAPVQLVIPWVDIQKLERTSNVFVADTIRMTTQNKERDSSMFLILDAVLKIMEQLVDVMLQRLLDNEVWSQMCKSQARSPRDLNTKKLVEEHHTDNHQCAQTQAHQPATCTLQSANINS
ncbi:uncharacterized protein LOC124963542 [Sciurus carolinensis]|uniref:uncharacterized protein LOC124963542 n=1 Tax=Sciurus carolinensis TaxID=30640 RepID=UPI001FB274F9|nr:uncharacterized protein LOC124963542 [Sciurus carolinensis]